MPHVSEMTLFLVKWSSWRLEKGNWSLESHRMILTLIIRKILCRKYSKVPKQALLLVKMGFMKAGNGYLKAGNGYLKAGIISSNLNFITMEILMLSLPIIWHFFPILRETALFLTKLGFLKTRKLYLKAGNTSDEVEFNLKHSLVSPME